MEPFPWKRFWCRREESFSLGDRGFLTDPESEHGQALNPHLTTLELLQAFGFLALLGEPGVGKSWSLNDDIEAFTKRTPGLEIVRLDLRKFGSEDRFYRALFEDPVFLRWAAGDHEVHVYLDDFDECLLRIETVAAILADELPKYPLQRMKLRIACRTAAWPAFLEAALTKAYGEENCAATELVPLRRKDVLKAATLSGITDPNAFLKRVDQLQLAPLAGKPITLNMLLQTYQRDGDLPTNLMRLYEKGCLILCEEQNESRRATKRTGILSAAGRLVIASRIAAVTQLGNHFAVWTGTEAAGVPPEDVSVSGLVGGTEGSERTLDVSSQAVLETLDTGLFSSRGEERLGWSHQTFAEYLAARYCLSHDLSLAQLRSLVFHPRRSRVIPQVREVASWLALQNDELLVEIAEKDPEVLLGSASPSLSAKQRQVLTDALLRSCDENEILHVHHNLALRNLAYPGLAEQLRPVLRERTGVRSTRYFAAQIVRACEVRALGDELLDIALSENEDHEMRTIAAYAMADVGSQDERERMRPLLTTTREADENDQLRGAALRAMYPGEVYDDAMWNYLEHPRRSLFFGSYNSFLTYAVEPKLNVQNLPAALAWCKAQPVDDIGPLCELEARIIALAVEHLEVPDIAKPLAEALFERCKSYRGFPEPRHSKDTGTEKRLQEDSARRRQFLAAFLPLLTKESEYMLIHPLSILRAEDMAWFIERIQTGVSPNPVAEARLVCRMASSREPEVLEILRIACASNATLAEECGGLFRPIPSEEMGLWQRPSREEFLKEHNLTEAPAVGPRVEAALRESEAGKADGWLKLLLEMSAKEGDTHYKDFWGMKPLELPGWVEAADETKQRIVEAAKRYLTVSTFPESGPAEPNRVRNGASAAVNALWMVQEVEPAFLQEEPERFWTRWIPSLIEDGRARDDHNEPVEVAFCLAAESAPEVMNGHLLDLIDVENSSDRKYLFCSTLLERAWSDSLAERIFQKVQRNVLHASIEASLLNMLLAKEVTGAREWMENVIQTEHETERGMASARVLLGAGEERAWPLLWSLIEADAQFGRALLEGFSYGRPDRNAFGADFSEAQLEDLYVWLAVQYPHENDRMVSGAVGPVDTIRFLRDGALEVLKKRGTFEACDSLARIELRLPRAKWMRYHFDEAEVLACALTWEPPSPQTILAMGMDGSKRSVESSEQLLEVLEESLQRFQAELHGDLAAVGDLWNNDGNEWWPKQEEDVSDYLARFLRRDLNDRGIVVNREVQIRRGRRGEMPGQNTDIHVDAVVPENVQGSSGYGAVSVVIEVKGTWNDGLMTDMERQLRDRYLRNSGCRTGLYVAAHFRADRWRMADGKRAKSDRLTADGLRTSLNEQAEALSGGVKIRSFVIDASLNSTLATGIEGNSDERARSSGSLA